MSFKFRTPVDVLEERTQKVPDKLAFLFLEQGEVETDRLTFGEVGARVRGMAAHLQSLFKPGERALLIYPTGLDFVIAIYGCLYAGLIPIPTNPPGRNRSAMRLDAITKDAQANLVLTTSEFLETFNQREEHFPELESRRWIDHGSIDFGSGERWKRPDLNPEQLAFIQYTSGSTNIPKGVMISQNNLSYNAYAVNQFRRREVSDESVILTWTPLFHDMGLINGIFQGVFDNNSSILMTPIAFIQKPLRWLKAITKYRATFTGGPNFAYEVCANKVQPEDCTDIDLSSWQVAVNGAEPVRLETLQTFAEKFAPFGFNAAAFQPGYGLAEATLVVSGITSGKQVVSFSADRVALEEGKVKAGDPADKANLQEMINCGLPMAELEIQIVNPQSCIRCKPDEIGEIWVRGGNIAEGYWNRPEETEKTFGAVIQGSGEGPFLRTGDLGFMRQGELYITGRLKDLIIVRGRNYYPQDVEVTVQKSDPSLRPGSGAAFSIKAGGSEQLIVVQEVRDPQQTLVPWDEIIKNIRKAIAQEHGIRAHGVALIGRGAIPKTSSGKIMRSEARSMLDNGEFKIVAQWRAPG